jgi:hypothetical protein
MISVIRPGFASKNVSKKSGFKVLGFFVFMFRAYSKFGEDVINSGVLLEQIIEISGTENSSCLLMWVWSGND